MLTQIVAYFIVSQKLAQLDVKREITKKKSQIRFTLGLFFFGKFLGAATRLAWKISWHATRFGVESSRRTEASPGEAYVWVLDQKTKATNLSHNIVNWGRL